MQLSPKRRRFVCWWKGAQRPPRSPSGWPQRSLKVLLCSVLFFFRVLLYAASRWLSGFVPLCATSLHKNMLNTRVEREKCSVWISSKIAICFYRGEIIWSNVIPSRWPIATFCFDASSIFTTDKFLPSHINLRGKFFIGSLRFRVDCWAICINEIFVFGWGKTSETKAKEKPIYVQLEKWFLQLESGKVFSWISIKVHPSSCYQIHISLPLCLEGHFPRILNKFYWRKILDFSVVRPCARP